MKRIVILLICLFPFLVVNAEEDVKDLSCLKTSSSDLFKVESDNANFSCSNIVGDTLTFFHNEKDLKDFFTYTIYEIDGKKTATIVVSDKLSFDSSFEYGIVKITDSRGKTVPLYIKNNAYVKPTQTTTVTTTNVSEITYTVVLDNKGKKEEKKCNVKKEGETCYVTLPNLETENFEGWGNSNTCKNGNVGSTKVNKNITYYACYKDNSNEETKEIYLKTLNILDNNNNKINFGVFSIKKQEYEFKVLNDVTSLIIEASSNEDVKVEYSGNENLLVGENEIIIKLSDNENNVNEYKLIVTRLEEGQTINSINYLSALVVGNYNINFNKEVFNYNLTIDNDINELVINAVPLIEDNLVEIKNNKELKDGSVISINVLDNEGSSTTYKINIIKERNNILLYIAIGVILLLIVILIILIII